MKQLIWALTLGLLASAAPPSQREECRPLAEPASELIATGCRAYVDATTGRTRAAYRDRSAALANWSRSDTLLLRLARESLLVALVGFNLGVEAGQLVLVALFLPLAYAARRTRVYRRVVFVGGSALIALVAALWMPERVFDLQVGLI